DTSQYLYTSGGGRPRRVANLTPQNPGDFNQLVGLAGSSGLLAWDYSVAIDERLDFAETTTFTVRRKGHNRRLATCGGGSPEGVDVSGAVVALGTGTCGRHAQIDVADYSGAGAPTHHAVVARYPTDAVQLAGRYV